MTSSRVKPFSGMPRSAHIGDAHSPGQPIDTDRRAARALGENDPAPGGTAVGGEADIADIGSAGFTREGQKLHPEKRWQAALRPRPPTINPARHLRIKHDPPLARYR